MLSKLICFLIVLGFVYSVFGAQWMTEPYQHPDHPGQCYDNEINEPVPIGKASSNNMGCKVMTCQDDFRFAVTSCPPFLIPKGCKGVKPDLGKPFPHCCSQVVCSDNLNVDMFLI